LAEAGYKPNDVKELLKLAKEVESDEAINDNDLKKPGENSEVNNTDEVDPIEAIIERNKKEKEGN